MPERMSEMWRQLGDPGRIDEDWTSSLHAWGGLAPLTQTAPAASLFPRLDVVAVIDTHCHVHDQKFDDDRDAVIARARAAGVTAMITVGEDLDDSRARSPKSRERYGPAGRRRHSSARSTQRSAQTSLPSCSRF